MIRLLILALLCVSGGARAQDAAAGETVFAACRLCHQLGENPKRVMGPALNGLIGRRAGTDMGFNYSPANKDSEIIWTEAALAAFLRDPRGTLPGNKMMYPGLKDDQKIADLIAFLKQYDAAGGKVP